LSGPCAPAHGPDAWRKDDQVTASVVVTFDAPPQMRAAVEDELDGVATVTYLPDVADRDRVTVLASADGVLGWGVGGELRTLEEFAALRSAGLLQTPILGFGGIGQATAALFEAFGARIHAVTRSGKTDRPADAVSTLADLDAVFAAASIVVITLPLNRDTHRLIGARELSLMKPDAILINVARAAIVDEDALYGHLVRYPAAANLARAIRGEPVQHRVDRADYLA
jgi:hypothetical protein